jgi:hypothetical protein
VTRRFDDADVQERLARPVGQFDEAEALLTIEPFHFGLPLGPSRDRPRRLARRSIKRPRRRATKRRRGFWRLIGITAPTITEVFASAHLQSV